MAMGGIRGPGRRGKDRSRATAAVLISATVVLAVLVGVGVVAFLNSGNSSTAQGGRLKLSNKITSQSSVGLANLGRTGQAGSSSSSATLLFAGAGGLLFTPGNGGGETVPSSQQWQADEMGGGGFVLLFSPTGQCLTAVGSGSQASAQLAPCDTGLDQRWYHPFEGTDSQGRDYSPLRSASDGRCLGLGTASAGGSVVAELQKCGTGKPWAQLVMFWSAY
jgi:Ricin-type beta-trefoil lectin domain-like